MTTLVFTGSLTRPMPQYGAANGRGLTSMAWDDAGRTLAVRSEVSGLDDTGWLVLDPRRGLLFSTFEQEGTRQSWIAAFRVDTATGQLAQINSQPLAGNEACHASLTPDGRFLLVATYNGATPAGWPDAALTVLPVGGDGALGAPVWSVSHQGSGPNVARQSTAHAHCVVPSPDGRMVYVADLGIDRIVAYDIDAAGQLTARPAAGIGVAPGLGPRHLVFNRDGTTLFMVSELTPAVMSFSVAPGTGRLTAIATFPIPASGQSIVQPAGIVLSDDGRFLFVGLRVCNEILGLAVDAGGELTQTGRWPSGGATPRDLAITPSGTSLIVANQDSDRLSVFSIDPHSGVLGGPVLQQPVGTPMTIKIAVF